MNKMFITNVFVEVKKENISSYICKYIHAYKHRHTYINIYIYINIKYK